METVDKVRQAEGELLRAAHVVESGNRAFAAAVLAAAREETNDSSPVTVFISDDAQSELSTLLLHAIALTTLCSTAMGDDHTSPLSEQRQTEHTVRTMSHVARLLDHGADIVLDEQQRQNRTNGKSLGIEPLYFDCAGMVELFNAVAVFMGGEASWKLSEEITQGYLSAIVDALHQAKAAIDELTPF